MQRPLSEREMEPRFAKLNAIIVTMMLFVTALQMKSISLCFWCCVIYVNTSFFFCIFFWFAMGLVRQKGEELNWDTLWTDTEFKMRGFLHMREKAGFSFFVSYYPYACPCTAPKDYDFIHQGIKPIFFLESYYEIKFLSILESR